MEQASSTLPGVGGLVSEPLIFLAALGQRDALVRASKGQLLHPLAVGDVVRLDFFTLRPADSLLPKFGIGKVELDGD